MNTEAFVDKKTENQACISLGYSRKNPNGRVYALIMPRSFLSFPI